MLQFAQYRGISPVSRAIRFLTRSDYSHTAILFNADFTLPQYHIPRGHVIEAWSPEVRLVKSLSDQHTPGTQVDIYEFWRPLTDAEFHRAALFLIHQLGKPYDWKDVLRFITHRPGQFSGRNPRDYPQFFCSCLAFAATQVARRPLFEHTSAWEVPPGWIHRSPCLRKVATIFTK